MVEVYWIYIYLFAAWSIARVPIVGNYFSVPNTMIHENFHILFARLSSGKGVSISLFSDTSGVALTQQRYRIGKIITAYAGYTGSSFAAILLFYCLYSGYYREILYFFIALSVYNLLFWVRNLYGIAWLISFIALTVSTVWFNLDTIAIHISIFLSCIVLIEQFTSALIVLKASYKDRKDAGDCTSLAKSTFIPALFWGVVFFAQSSFAIYYVFSTYLY